MLDVTLKYREVFELMLDEDGHFILYLGEEGHGRRGLGPPTLEDWEHIRHFVKFLKLFYEVTVRMSGSNVSTTNVYLEELAKIHSHLDKYSSSNDTLLKEIASRMKTKYDKYCGNLMIVNRLLFVAALLDPRNKMVVLNYWFKKVLGEAEGEVMSLNVKTTLERLFTEYKYNNGNHGSVGEVGDSESVTLGDNEDWDEFDLVRAASQMSDSKSEVERYLSESVESKTPSF
jgi:hypothetical protein